MVEVITNDATFDRSLTYDRSLIDHELIINSDRSLIKMQ